MTEVFFSQFLIQFFSRFWKQQLWTHQLSTIGSIVFLLINTPIRPIWKNNKLICSKLQ
jgi:hypothetical protein